MSWKNLRHPKRSTKMCVTIFMGFSFLGVFSNYSYANLFGIAQTSSGWVVIVLLVILFYIGQCQSEEIVSWKRLCD